MDNNSAQETQRLIDEQNARMASVAGSLNDAWSREAGRLGSATSDLSLSTREAGQTLDMAARGLNELGSGAIQFSRALTSGQDGLSKYGNALNTAGNGLGTLLMSLGPVGAVLGAFTKLFTSTVDSVFGRVDNLNKGFDQLAELGGAAQFTTKTLGDLAKDANYLPVNGESLKLVKIISDLGPSLMSLGNTSGEGMKKFAEIASFATKSKEEQNLIRNQFNTIGISQEKLTKYQADYVKQQGMLNQSRAKEPKQLSDESLKYVTTLASLAALTGETTETISQNRKKDLENFAFNITLRELSTTEAGKKQADMYLSMAQMMRSNVSGTAAQAFMDALSSPQKMSQSVVSMLGETQGQFTNWMQDFKSGKLTGEGLINKLNESGNKTLMQMATSLKANPELAARMNMSAERVANLNKNVAEGSLEAKQKELEEAKNRVDSNKDIQNTSNNASAALSTAFDSFIELIQGPVTTGFQALMKGLQVLMKGFMKKFGDWVDMPPELPYLFDSTEDLIKQQKELTTELEKKQQAVAKAREEDANAIKDPTSGDTGSMEGYAEKELNEVNKQLMAIDKARRIRDGENYKKVDESLKKQQEQKEENSKTKATTTTATVSDNKSAQTNANTPQVDATPSDSSVPNPQLPTADIKPVMKMRQGGKINKTFSSGGVLQGPDSGYKTVMPGNKDYAVVPLPNGDSIPVSFMSNNRNSLLSNSSGVNSLMDSYIQNLKKTNVDPTSTSAPGTSNSKMAGIALESISNKLNIVLSVMKENNGLQKDMLQSVKG